MDNELKRETPLFVEQEDNKSRNASPLLYIGSKEKIKEQ